MTYPHTGKRREPCWGERAWTPLEALSARFAAARRQTTALCEPIEIEDYVAQSMPDASPAKWHLAHTTWYFETFVLKRFVPGYRVFHAQFEYLFNSYYNAVGERVKRPERGLITRPTLAEVRRYREHVDEVVSQLLSREPDNGDAAAVSALIEIGINHEQQHQELILTDIKHLLSLNPMRPAYRLREADGPRLDLPAPASWQSFDAGIREIGHAGAGFAFDNEAPRHRVWLEAFEMADRLVTNGEYLAFMDDHGYQRPELWLDEGWTAVQREGWRRPLYWQAGDNAGWVYTLGGVKPLNLHEPVCHVSFHEAYAYAAWAGARLPGEAEWETACDESVAGANLLDCGRLHPAVQRTTDTGPQQQYLGDVWEWTCSPYRPYPGYRPAPGALGEYNGKFMCSQFVLRGGSCCTPDSHIRSTYRNFFYPEARWQFSGIRLARDA